jgi:DeoR/GlpR family transcriptional regulator of sugar metabolism
MTIRRDLDALVTQGVARRVRGGAISLLMRGEEPPFGMRQLDAAEQKARIAERVAALLREGESVALDSGTTALLVAQSLVEHRFTVMPMCLQAVSALSSAPGIRLLLPGGESRASELALVGPLALASIAAVRFDTAVLGCCGLAAGHITAHDLQDAAIKQALISSSARVIMAADGSKFGRTALAAVAETSAIDVVVTDRGAPTAALEALRKEGVDVQCV